MEINDLLRIAIERKASDLHLKVGNYPYLRIDGELVPLTDQARISSEDMLNMAFSMMSNRQKQKFKENAELDMAYGVAGLGRFRVNVFQQRGNVGMVLRVIPTKIRTLDELYLPKVVDRVCDESRGLVLVTGITGSGKSTTLAAMIDRINSTRAEHIITIEDPIEFLHRDKKGFVNQREVEVDTPSFAAALRAQPAPGPGRHSGRRNARPGNHRARRCTGGRNRPHRVLHPAHAGCGRDHQPHHRRVSAPRAETDPAATGGDLTSGRQPAPGAARRWRGPRAGGRGHGEYAVHPRMHLTPEKTRVIREAIAPAPRSTACRPSTSRSMTFIRGV